MPTKTYQAETMMQALEQIQLEMGEDAIVLSVRNIQLGPNWQVWRKTGVEVVAVTPDLLSKAAGEPAKEKESATAKAPVIRKSASGRGIEFVEEAPEIEWAGGTDKPAAVKPGKPAWPPQRINVEPPAPEVDRAALFRGDLEAAIGRAVEAVKEAEAAKSRPAVLAPDAVKSPHLPDPVQKVLRPLRHHGLERAFLEQLAKSLMEQIPVNRQDESSCKTFLRQELEAGLVMQPPLAADRTGRTLVVIGASGAGKTSTIAKLAFFYSNMMGKKVTWVGADTVRTGAIAETRAFTDALGIPLRLVYTAEDLGSACETHDSSEMILVDMPGYNPYNERHMVDLGNVLTEVPDRTTYLVVSATTKDSDMNQAVAAMGLFHLNGLIVTKLDETMTYGSVYNLARRSKLPLVFFTNGKEASANLHIADPRRLVNALFGKGWLL